MYFERMGPTESRPSILSGNSSVKRTLNSILDSKNAIFIIQNIVIVLIVYAGNSFSAEKFINVMEQHFINVAIK